ncbi:MAG: hypothetical protein ACREWE_00320 [Gammaproteobacteria bacterium]
MNRNHIDDRWRQCHWGEWREIKNRWNQVRKTGEEPNQQPKVVELHPVPVEGERAHKPAITTPLRAPASLMAK